MKRISALIVLITVLLTLVSCSQSKPYQGEPIASSSASDTQLWTTDTFFASAPIACEYVSSLSWNKTRTTYTIKIENISYDDYCAWVKAMRKSGAKPIGVGEYATDGEPINGSAAFNAQTKLYTVMSKWTEDSSPERNSNYDLSISFIKK